MSTATLQPSLLDTSTWTLDLTPAPEPAIEPAPVVQAEPTTGCPVRGGKPHHPVTCLPYSTSTPYAPVAYQPYCSFCGATNV